MVSYFIYFGGTNLFQLFISENGVHMWDMKTNVSFEKYCGEKITNEVKRDV